MKVSSTGTRGLVVFLLLGVAGLVLTGWWLWKATEGIENTRKHRSAVKSAILQELREKYNSPVLGIGLDSHCSKAVLSVAVGGQGEVVHHYRYDIDTGQSVSVEWWERCLRIRPGIDFTP